MSTTYFNTKKSNIDKLTKKSTKNKDKKNNTGTDEKDKTKEDTTEKNVDDKVVENFSNPFSGKNKDDSDDKPKKSEKESDPMGNVFSSSDKNTTTGKDDTNTQTSAKEQLNSDKFILFLLHALVCVLITYIWGLLATNYLYLSSESRDNLDYILPTKEYQLPYTNNPKQKCWYEYGFPYNLGKGREVTADSGDYTDIMRRQKDTTYYLWLSKESVAKNQTGLYQVDFFGALQQYIFEAVYGGLGRGGRSLIRTLLSLVGVVDKDLPSNKDSWDLMKDSFPRKLVAFILFPFVALNLLIPGVAMWSGITAFVYGIIQEHIWWGLFFSFTIGMFIAMGCGLYMGIQSIYIFFLYPWMNNGSRTKGKWGEIFNSLKTYMLFAFYLLICFYAFEDLGHAGGAGIMLIVVASIIMQWKKDSDDKK